MARYTVGKPRQTTIIDDSGDLAQVWEVPYTTPDGIKGKVDVPVSDYTAETVDAAITAQVNAHNAVTQLGQ